MKMKSYGTTAILTVLLCFSLGRSGGVWAGAFRLTVSGEGTELDELPLVAEIAAALPVGTYRLTSTDGAAANPAEVFEDHGKRFLAVILGRRTKAQDSRYSLDAANPGDISPSHAVSVSKNGGDLRVEIDGRLLTEYRVGVGHKPFFFPLVGPTGVRFTRAYPMETVAGEDRDHPHQRSCWLTHGKVNGIDFWSEAAAAGTISETARAVIVQGPVVARIWTKNDWIAPDARKVCSDERSVTFHRTTGARILDFDFAIRADSAPVTFGETKEGMFGLRVASSMDVAKKSGGKITNAEGLTDESAWGEASPWVDYTGPVGGNTVGIAVLNHPESFRYPTNWHVRPYGLFAANPFGGRDFHKPDRGDFTIAPGESIRFRYRVILHEGTTAVAGLPAHFRAYSRPPKVELTQE
jgi:hypothetical protein